MRVNFIIAGFQKCGTTALHSFLSAHPKVIGSNPKELDFFNYHENYKKGFDYYHSFFASKRFSGLRGYNYLEASPSYINDKDTRDTAIKIMQYNRKMKIVVLVRNPIDRAYSAWSMYKSRFDKGNINWWFDWCELRDGVKPIADKRTVYDYQSFDNFVLNELEAIKNNKNLECSVLNTGRYDKGIQIFKEIFNDNLIVIKNEDLLNNTPKVLSRLGSFLNLRSYDWSVLKGKKIFTGEYDKKINIQVKDELISYYTDSDMKLFQITGIKYF